MTPLRLLLVAAMFVCGVLALLGDGIIDAAQWFVMASIAIAAYTPEDRFYFTEPGPPGPPGPAGASGPFCDCRCEEER